MHIMSNGVATSDAAAASIVGHAARLRELVFDTIKTFGEAGLTCDEVENITGLAHQTASARVYDLRKLGRLVETGETRPTRSGRKAMVWKAVA